MAPSATTWTIVLLLALMSGLTTLLGVALAIRLEKSARAIALGIGFSAGIMLLISASHLFEERGLLDVAMPRVSTLVALGLILHDVPEGIAMANAYVDSPSLGVRVSLAIALHNVPEEFAMAVPAVASGRRGMLFAAAFVSALAEPVARSSGWPSCSSSPRSTPSSSPWRPAP